MRVPKRKSEDIRRLKQDDGPIYLTQNGLDRMHRTMRRIERDLPAVREEVRVTREMGDLSENAAYQIAKGRMRGMQYRLTRMQEDIKRVVVIKNEGGDVVRLGSTVSLLLDDQEYTYELVGPRESDPLNGRISHMSPLGQALNGLRLGEESEINLPGGKKKVVIRSID